MDIGRNICSAFQLSVLIQKTPTQNCCNFLTCHTNSIYPSDLCFTAAAKFVFFVLRYSYNVQLNFVVFIYHHSFIFKTQRKTFNYPTRNHSKRNLSLLKYYTKRKGVNAKSACVTFVLKKRLGYEMTENRSDKLYNHLLNIIFHQFYIFRKWHTNGYSHLSFSR